MRLLSIFLVLVLASPAAAQIVNVQAKIEDVPEGVSGSVEGSLDWRTGNTELLLVGGGGRLAYRKGGTLVFAIVRGDYGKIFHTEPNTEIVARTFEHVRLRRTIKPWLVGEAFVQNEADKFRRLKIRALAGAGPRFVVSTGKRHGVFYGLAYMYEYERLNDDDEVDANARFHNHRASTYLVSHFEANDAVKLTEAVYLQPRLDDPTDFRTLVDLSVSSKVSDHLSVKTSFILTYDANPPAGIADVETALETKLEASF